jgi:hypothetical protein
VNSKAGAATVVDMAGLDDKTDDVAAFLAADPELESRLPAIEERVLDHFGPGARVERTVAHLHDEEDADDVFVLRVVTDLDLDEKLDRLGVLLDEQHELLAPFKPRLRVGIL